MPYRRQSLAVRLLLLRRCRPMRSLSCQHCGAALLLDRSVPTITILVSRVPAGAVVETSLLGKRRMKRIRSATQPEAGRPWSTSRRCHAYAARFANFSKEIIFIQSHSWS